MKPRAALAVRLILIATLVAAFAGCRPRQTRSSRPIVLKIAHAMPVAYHYQPALEHFARLVGKNTKGRVELQIIADGGAGNEDEMVQRVRNGELDMALVSSSALGGVDPAIYSLDLPYLFKTRKQAQTLLDGRLGRIFSKRFVPHGLRILAWWENGYVDIASAKEPVKAPADLGGTSIVVDDSLIESVVFKSLDATPMAAPVPQNLRSFGSGRGDAIAAPPAQLSGLPVSKRIKFFTPTNHRYSAAPLLIGYATYMRLPVNVRNALSKAAQETSEYERKLSADAAKTAVSELGAEPVQSVTPDPAFAGSARELDAKAKDELSLRLAFGPDIVDQVLLLAGHKQR